MKFIEPEMEIITFKAEDVITASSTDDGNDGNGGQGNKGDNETDIL